MTVRRRPGGELASRPLHFIWILDCSSSMGGNSGKIQALNHAIRESIPHMRRVAGENPNAKVLVRAVKFSSGAEWFIANPTPVEHFEWNKDLEANGWTDMGRALELVADQLRIPPMEQRALPPVLVLVSDGQPTDDFASGLNKLLSLPWGHRAVRIAIAIGQDAEHDVLQEFINHPELKPLQANNVEALVQHIQWASTEPVKAASAPPSQVDAAPSGGNVPIVQPPSYSGNINDVW